MRLRQSKIENILFLDIETVPEVYKFSELDEKTGELYLQKNRYLIERDELSNDEIYEKAGVFAEFGKIVCISVGVVRTNSMSDKTITMKSYASHDEHKLLTEFGEMLTKSYNSPNHSMCGHNAKEFDFPFIARRMLLNGIDIPKILDIAGKKPWEVNLLDTMELWKFGDFKNYTSLDLLTAIFDIPTPKDDIDGSEVWSVYWKEKDLERIKTYCEKDTIAVVQILLSYMGSELMREDQINYK